MAISDLSRFERFLSIPVENIQSRDKFALTEAEVGELHTLAVNRQTSWDLYHQANNAMKADEIFRHVGKERGWTVAYIREQLGRKMYRHYVRSGEDIHEYVSGRLWPIGFHIERIRSKKDPLRIIHEVELAFSPNTDLEGLWKRQRSGFEQDGIELLKTFPNNQFVQDMCFLPGNHNFSARIVLSAGRKRKELTYPIGLRYESLLRKIAKQYTLDTTLEPKPNSKEPLQRASTEELLEVLAGLWGAVRKYDPSTDVPVPKYVKNQLQWHMGEQFKKRSKAIKDSEAGKTRRVLRADLDREAGSLDDPIYRKDGTESGILADTISDPNAKPPDQQIMLQQILDSLGDETDKKIVHLMRQEVSQKEIAKQLRISQPAVSKRLKRLGERVLAKHATR